MNQPIGIFTLDDATAIRRQVLGKATSGQPSDAAKKQNVTGKAYYVKLLQDLAAATDAKTGYTQAEAVVLKYGPSADNLDMDEAGTSDSEKITVTNRSKVFTGLTGDYLFVIRMGAEYVPQVSGTATTVIGTCECTCIEDGDITVGGHTTTSVWIVSLSEITVDETYGRVTLPASDHLLFWQSGSGWWSKNIGAALVAVRYDGTPVTLTPTPSPAYIRFEHNSSGYQKLTIQWPDNLIGP
jgi:hypothetical protein